MIAERGVASLGTAFVFPGSHTVNYKAEWASPTRRIVAEVSLSRLWSAYPYESFEYLFRSVNRFALLTCG